MNAQLLPGIGTAMLINKNNLQFEKTRNVLLDKLPSEQSKQQTVASILNDIWAWRGVSEHSLYPV